MILNCCFYDLDWQTIWTAVGAIAATLGIIYIGRQLQLQVWINLQKIFTEDKFTEARSNVFKSLDTDISELSNNDINDLKENIKIVCRKMDEFCHLKSFFWKRKIIKYWWNPVGKAWGLLQPVVRLEREETRWPKKWEAFEYMGNKCLPMFSMDEKSEFAEKAKEIISLFNNKK